MVRSLAGTARKGSEVVVDSGAIAEGEFVQFGATNGKRMALEPIG